MNFRHILSKTSLTTEKSLCSSEEVSKLQSEIELLKQTIESLKISVESKDAAIGTLAREKEKLYVELKSAQRTNRNLHQQFVDERDIYSKEKDYLIEEIKRLSKNNTYAAGKETHIERNILEAHSESSLKEELKSKDEIIYNVCTKYLKIKSSKERLRNKLEKLERKSQQVCESIILLLNENRTNIDSVLRKLVKSSSITPSTKSYLNLLKVNANLHYENTELKVYLSLKDFPSECEVESSHRVTSLKNSMSQIKILRNVSTIKKPKYKVNQPCQKLRLSHNEIRKLEKPRKFSSIHALFAPYFRRKRLYESEPDLANFSYESVT